VNAPDRFWSSSPLQNFLLAKLPVGQNSWNPRTKKNRKEGGQTQTGNETRELQEKKTNLRNSACFYASKTIFSKIVENEGEA